METSRHLRLQTEDARLPPQIPSRISTAANSLLPGNSSLNQSRSRIDKSATRIATYITVYGRKSGSDRSSRTSRTSFRSQKSEDPPPLESRPISRRTHVTVTATTVPAPEPSAPGNIRSLQRQTEALREEICRAVSDRLDLYRDLASYEYLFDRKAGLGERLAEVQRTAEGLPDVMVSLSSVSNTSESMLQTLRNHLNRLSAIKPQQQNQDIYRLKRAKTGLRDVNTRHYVTNQYRGCAEISGIKALVQVSADLTLDHFRVKAQTLDGLGLSLSFAYSIGLEGSPSHSIKQRLLPFLHLISQNHHWSLHFDPVYGSSFRTVIAKPLGLDFPLCFLLIEDENSVTIRSPDLDSFLSVPISALTTCKSLFEMTSKALRNVLERQLFLRKEPVQMGWLEDRNALFAGKEKGSKLMDAEYLSEALGDFVLVLMAKDEVEVDGLRFGVEIYAHRTVERLRIVHEEQAVEVEEGGKQLAFLKEMQFGLLHQQPKTVFRSLEMATVIRSLFLSKLGPRV